MLPLALGIQVPQQANAEHQCFNDRVPPRVLIAMQFLTSLTHKAHKTVAVNDVGFHEMPGVSLTKAELNAQASAANLINDYFNGKLTPDAMERIEYQLRKEQVKPKKQILIRCPVCSSAGQISSACQLCDGNGFCTVQPAIGGKG